MSTRLKKFMFILLTLLLFSASVLACSVVVIRTPVEVPRNVVVWLKYENLALSNVELRLRDQTGMTLQRAATDVRGRAEFLGLSKGEYSITSETSYEDLIKSTGADGTADLTVAADVPSKPMSLASLEGTVVDKSGAVLPKAIVVLERLDERHTPVAVTTSDERGRFKLSAKPETYIMRIAYPGFATAVVPVRVDPSGERAFAITLPVANCGEGDYGTKPK